MIDNRRCTNINCNAICGVVSRDNRSSTRAASCSVGSQKGSKDSGGERQEGSVLGAAAAGDRGGAGGSVALRRGCSAGQAVDAAAAQEAEAAAASMNEPTLKMFANSYSVGSTRVQFQQKDPRGWEEFRDQLAEHSAMGSALTMRGVQTSMNWPSAAS